MPTPKKASPRVLAVMMDQLAGHWADGVTIQSTGFPPPNVEAYHQLGLIPNISSCIREGLSVRRPWNRGICSTIQVSRYVVYGVYSHKGGEHIVRAVKSEHPTLKTAAFSNWAWDHAQYYAHPNYHIGAKHFDFNFSTHTRIKDELSAKLPHLSGEALKKAYAVEILTPYELKCLKRSELTGETLDLEKAYLVERRRRAEEKRSDPISDRDLLHQHVVPWMRENRDWGMIYMHWVDHDQTTAPAFVENPAAPFDDKHHHLTDYVDKNVGDLVQFLKKEDFWEDTYLILFSDHGYHLNCTVPDAQEMGRDFCANHMFPHDCFVWDYEKGKTAKIYSGGCRRIFMTVSGGALSPALRGRQIEKGEIIDHLYDPVEADIIDIPATIADIYGVPYGGEGTSVFSRL